MTLQEALKLYVLAMCQIALVKGVVFSNLQISRHFFVELKGRLPMHFVEELWFFLYLHILYISVQDFFPLF